MNNDLISREDLKKAISDNGYSHYFEIFKIIDDAPTVEPTFGVFKAICCEDCEKRPHGKWINHPIKEFEEWDICTACGTGCRRRIYEDNALTVYNYPFCPNCGAQMNGGEDE